VTFEDLFLCGTLEISIRTNHHDSVIVCGNCNLSAKISTLSNDYSSIRSLK